MPTVTMHIGAFKTGTSFVQAVMTQNKPTLAEEGVLWPGRRWGHQVRAVKGLRRPDRFADWTALADEVNAWGGHSSVISMEALSLLNATEAVRAVQSFPKQRVRVVLTARDLGRVFPAQWQESVQNSWTWSYSDYIAGVIEGDVRHRRAHRHFWSKQDLPRILRTWGEVVSPADIVVVTVPPAGSPKGLLWERFCEATGLEANCYDSSMRVNESLGAASAEVMRYVTASAPKADVSRSLSHTLKKVLAKQSLAGHKKREATLVLPQAHHGWAEEQSQRLIAEVAQIGSPVVGDLADLSPRFDVPDGPTTTDPSQLPREDLLEAAAHGLVSLSSLLAADGHSAHGDEFASD